MPRNSYQIKHRFVINMLIIICNKIIWLNHENYYVLIQYFDVNYNKLLLFEAFRLLNFALKNQHFKTVSEQRNDIDTRKKKTWHEFFFRESEDST